MHLSLLSAFAAAMLHVTHAATISTSTIFFTQDGNWTTHEQKPSAIFFKDAVIYETAVSTCESYGEELLDCSDFASFASEFSYQIYLGNVAASQSYWSSCSTSATVTSNGTSLSASSFPSNSSTAAFLCTNTAPIVKAVNTDYSIFPRINASVNGTTFTGLRDHMAYRFLGVPFAEPPVNDLRFEYAVPYNGSHVNATVYKPACLQYGVFGADNDTFNPWGTSEDCLYLNVYTPSIYSAEDVTTNSNSVSLKPVMVWIYGGGENTGSAADSTFDGASLASRSDVVVVAMNYRVNIFGSLALNDSVVNGNYALSDKIAALEWVQRYATAFGGDPTNVTVFGQSAGGWSVIDLIISPKAKGLFSGAIQQSAGSGHVAAQSDVAAAALPYIEALCGQTDAAERLVCLKALPADTLLNVTNYDSSWSAVVDGEYVLDLPLATIAKGADAINAVNLMAGFMPDEGQSLIGTAIDTNATDFDSTLNSIVGYLLTAAEADAITSSNLWIVSNTTYDNGTSSYSSAYNATVNAATDVFLTCGGVQYARIAASGNAFASQWVYSMNRAYGLNYFDPYNLCTFPVGEPETPYYKCHSGDLYEVWGTYYLFDLPIRVDEDIYFTNAIQDFWAAFARGGDPNPSLEYLEARGYQTTIDLISGGWVWPEFDALTYEVAELEYPGVGVGTLPDQEHCEVILKVA